MSRKRLTALAFLSTSTLASADKNEILYMAFNQGNADAEIKRIYQFSAVGLQPLSDPEAIKLSTDASIDRVLQDFNL